jgi:hypothetical protein
MLLAPIGVYFEYMRIAWREYWIREKCSSAGLRCLWITKPSLCGVLIIHISVVALANPGLAKPRR